MALKFKQKLLNTLFCTVTVVLNDTTGKKNKKNYVHPVYNVQSSLKTNFSST